MEIDSKLPNLSVNIFTQMSQLAQEYSALNLSQGFPDFDVTPELTALVKGYMDKGLNQYAPMQGVLALRERIRSKVFKLHGASYDTQTEITITSGATEALFAAITAVVNPGDEVIVFEPAYDSYVPAILLNKGIPVFLEMKYPDYRIDWNEVKDSLTDKTRLIILNSPHNPTGKILDQEDIKALGQIVEKRPIMILSDEVYEHIVFDGVSHQSMARYPELKERSFVVSSFGKTYHTTGWKVGYCLAPKALSREFQRIHQYLTFSVNTPIQLALADIMDKEDLYLGLSEFYQIKRDHFLSLLAGSRFRPLACRGTFFLMLDYSRITQEKDHSFARRMTIEHGVTAIPPSVFYHDEKDHRVLRFCFAKKNQTLEKAAKILCKL
ncbi:MAG: aminotransferase class I/II-fold pyridoxal phosphate-dependent enzyme [Proteobacteria bacterium]|nr:aminotransferase class I/II-fold pyridoxal phosphate-dependent enzyme [Pseudomonadota bacterium]